MTTNQPWRYHTHGYCTLTWKCCWYIVHFIILEFSFFKVYKNSKDLWSVYRTSSSPYQSISLYSWFISSLKGSNQDKAFRVQGNFTLPSPSVPCLFIEKNTEEGLLRPLAPCVLVVFYEAQGIRWMYSHTPNTTLIDNNTTSRCSVLLPAARPQCTAVFLACFRYLLW